MRLRPNGRGTIALGTNPPADYSTNAHGWRSGPELVPDRNSIVIVGDSQVFGLGVDDDNTVAARLSAHTGRPVHNGGVPTYGPEEYGLVIHELLEASQASTCILVVNFANDLFELGRPNTERHAVWDGWAVRIETAPASVLSFPGRAWLMSQSHLVHAVRRWWHGSTAPDGGLPSEGDLQSLLNTSVPLSHSARAPAEEELRAALVQAVRQQAEAQTSQRALEAEISWQLADSSEDRLALQAIVEGASAGDIVSDRYSEAGRAVPVTAALLRQGARLNRDLQKDVAAWLRAHPDHAISQRIAATSRTKQEAEAEVARISRTVAQEMTGGGPLGHLIDRAASMAALHDAELVVVALPLDVQVDPTRFATYNAPSVDMGDTLAVLDQLEHLARSRGHRAVSVLPALQESGGAGLFLDGDLHLTAEGQDVFAQAIASALEGPPPPAWPGPELKEGRSRVPLPEEWRGLRENLVRGSSRNHCQTWRLREWQRIHCVSPTAGAPVRSARLEAAPAESMVVAATGFVDVVLPVLPGRTALVDIRWADRTQRLTVPAEGPPWFAPAPDDSEGSDWAVVLQDELCVPLEGRFGDGAADCGHWSDCADRWGCRQGDRLHAPQCGPDEAPAGAAQLCQVLCDAQTPCSSGTCEQWQRGGFCQ